MRKAGNGRRRWRRSSRKLRRDISAWLPKLRYPIREGEHDQTAFAFGLIWDWAEVTHNAAMKQLLQAKASEFYERDRACPLAYEPSGQDFLSPCLAEADFMRRVLEPQRFAAWLTSFLPQIATDGSTSPGCQPAEVTDRSDPKLAHIDGLNLSRAWMLEGIARGLPAADARVRSLHAAAARHREVSLGAVTASTTSAVTGSAHSRSTGIVRRRRSLKKITVSQKGPSGSSAKRGHRADSLPAAAFVEPLGLGTRGVEHQQGAAGLERGTFRGGQHQRADAVTARAALHQHLGNVGAMRLVFLRRPHGLRGAQDLAAFIHGDDQRAFVSPETLGDTTPIRFRLVLRHGPHEIHRRAAFHAVDEHITKSRQFVRTDNVEFAYHRHAHGRRRTLFGKSFRKPLARTRGVRLAGVLIEEGIGLRVASAGLDLGVEIERLGMRREQDVALQSRDGVDGFFEDFTRFASAVNLKPGAEIEFRLSAYTMFMQ